MFRECFRKMQFSADKHQRNPALPANPALCLSAIPCLTACSRHVTIITVKNLMNLTQILSASLVLALTSPLASASHAAAPPVRRHIRMDAGWRFQRTAPVVLSGTKAVTVWRGRSCTPDEAAALAAPAADTSGPDWKESASGQDAFAGRVGFEVYRASLPALSRRGRTLHFQSVDDMGTVYLNGKKLVVHSGWNDPFDVPLDTAWNSAGPNVVAVLVENTSGPGGITGDVSVGFAPASSRTTDPSQPAFDDRGWRIVHLPHDYVVEGAFTPKGDTSHGSLLAASAWYRKTFTLPASDKGKALWIDFDGAYRDSTVYLNGVKLGTHPCGYTPFRFDIARAARYGASNVLAVQVNPQKFEGWWYEGGGLYRHVWLNVAAPVHVAPWGTFVTAKLPEPVPGQPVPPATVTVKTTVAYPDEFYGNGAFTVVSRLFDPSGRPAGTATAPAHVLYADRKPVQRILVAHPALWSLETPQLYRLHTEIRQAGRVVDTQDTPFGIRTIRFDAQNGFFLNGKSVKVKGTCNHQDFAGVGIALPDSLLSWRIKQLKKMGSNAYRMSHNPPASELLDACDAQGMLVMDENRHLGDTEDGKAAPDTPYADLHEVQAMVLRDRNHPSIILWSMCNEEPLQNSDAGARIFSAMKKVVDAADGTRPVTCAMNSGQYSGIALVEDVRGFNYGPDAYEGYHKAHPEAILYGSETSSEVGTRGVYGPDRFKIDGISYAGDQAKGYVSAYDIHAPGWAQTAEAAWQPIADRSYVFGGFVWTGFDYKGETTPFGWPDVNSHFGIMDLCGFPKDSYYYYQSVWGGKPMIHVFPHWNWAGKEGKPIDVWVYSNAARVELSLNGASLGVKDMPKNGHLSWSVPYAPGTLTAQGFDAAGRATTQDIAETTGPPAALKLSTDRRALTADGEDVTLVEVDVVDAEGRLVPTAGSRVSFQVTGTGRIAGVGNGDPSDHDPDQASFRRAFGGKCLVIVGAGESPGRIHLAASSPGLTSAALSLSVR